MVSGSSTIISMRSAEKTSGELFKLDQGTWDLVSAARKAQRQFKKNFDCYTVVGSD